MHPLPHPSAPGQWRGLQSNPLRSDLAHLSPQAPPPTHSGVFGIPTDVSLTKLKCCVYMCLQWAERRLCQILYPFP